MNNKTYIKLSRIRDYGIGKEEGDYILRFNELATLSSNQLKNLKSILEEEIDDINYQISHEQKHMNHKEHDLKWYYGAKSSREARIYFIRQIDKILEEDKNNDCELVQLRLFRSIAFGLLDLEMFNKIEQFVKNELLSQETAKNKNFQVCNKSDVNV